VALGPWAAFLHIVHIDGNTASGYGALQSNSIGSFNIAVGFGAGDNLATGSNNIDIGNAGLPAETNSIRIGIRTVQSATYIAGIYGTSANGNAVVVSPTGQLGVVVSSERFKTTVKSMGSNSAKLGQLRPVTFHLKADPKGTLQYGLIAEEVAKVYPELVIRDEKGRIDGVRYDELAPMLLNEVQQQQKAAAAQAARSRRWRTSMRLRLWKSAILNSKSQN
jgi:Chaperone of endosialidase